MKITLHIDRLILDGVQVAQAGVPRLREVLEQDLARLVMDRGLALGLVKGAAVAALTGSAITPRTLPRPLAQQIAGAVYAAIGNSVLLSSSLASRAGEGCPERGRRGWGEGPEPGERR